MNEITSFERDKAQIEPHSIEAEQQILGSVLVDNERFHLVSSMLRADHFYDPVHGRIWQRCQDRITKEHLVSPVTLKEDMQGDEGLQELGGPVYLVRLAAASISGQMIADYAEMVVELYGKRRALERIRAAEADLTSGRDLSDVTADLELMLHEQEEHRTEPRSMSLLAAHQQSMRDMQDVQEGRAVAIPTGISALDERVVMAPKRYTLLGGSTSMGKTALALSIMHNAAKAGFGSAIVSLEMPETDLARRFASAESGIHYKQMDRPMSGATLQKVVEAMHKQESLPVQIFGHQVRDIPATISECRRLQQKWKPRGEFKGLKLLVIDYIQLMRGRGESQFVRLSQVANDLKQVAKMLDVHVLALAQVDRQLTGSDDWRAARPKLSALRGSGDLENAPDNVLFVFRPEYFLGRALLSSPKDVEARADLEAEFSNWKDKAEIIIGKSRMGEVGAFSVGCDMATNRFFDLPDQQQEIEF
jgi:replicative DNA helicase